MTELELNKGYNYRLSLKIGLTKAAIIQQIDYWLQKTNNIHDGKKWVYNTLKDWHNQDFGFISLNAMINNFNALVDMGLLVTGNFNKWRGDRTKWYTIDYDKLNELIDEEPVQQSETVLQPDESDQKPITKNKNNQLPEIGKWGCQKLVKQYHKTTQEITHNINNSNSNKSESQSVNRETTDQHQLTKSNKRYYQQYKNKQTKKPYYYAPTKKTVEKATDWSKHQAEKVDVDVNALKNFFVDFEAKVSSGQLQA